MHDNVEESWAFLRNGIYSSAYNILSTNKCKNQDWFDENEEIKQLLNEKHRLHQAYLNNQSSWGKQNSVISATKFNASWERCKTVGLARRWTRSSIMQTQMIWRVFMMPSEQSVVLIKLAHLLFSVLMGLHCSLINIRYCRDGPNTLSLSSIDHQTSVMRPSTIFLRFQSIMNSMFYLPILK